MSLHIDDENMDDVGSISTLSITTGDVAKGDNKGMATFHFFSAGAMIFIEDGALCWSLVGGEHIFPDVMENI